MNKLILTAFLLLYFAAPNLAGAAEEIQLKITEDAYIDSIQFYDIVAAHSRLLLGFGDTTGNGITQIFLKYSVDELVERNITPDQIEDARLKMYQYRNKYGTDYEITVNEPDMDWEEETLAWNNQPALKPPKLETQIITSALDWKDIDITDIFVEQFRDFGNRYGLVLLMDEPYSSGGSFYSTNCLSGFYLPICPPEHSPYIVVTLKEEPQLELKSPLPNANFTENEVSFSWSLNKTEELYKVEISDDSNFIDLLSSSNWISEPSFSLKELESGKYYWRIKSYFSKLTSETRSFQIEEKDDPPKDESSNETEAKETIEVPEKEEVSQKVLGTSTTENKNGYCKFRFNTTKNIIQRIRCKLEKPTLPRIKHLLSQEIFWLDTTVTVPSEMDIFIEYTKCKRRNLFQPSTWFGCSEERIETTQKTVPINGSLWAVSQGKKLDGYKKRISEEEYQVNFPLDANWSSKRFIVRYSTSYSEQIEEGVWLDLYEFSPKSNTAGIPKVEISHFDLKSFRLPFNSTVGVTQWYGNTKYQQPHTGIDFGVRMEPVYAVADGEVVSVGWDKGKNRCVSGGKFLLIKHRKNSHTLLLHLSDYKNNKGKDLKVRDKVYKGQRIGTTGNSGRYNCEPLGYHLHFEVRNARAQNTHTNPVPLIAANWSKIPTLGYSSYPGRLTGENPHPGR